MQILKNVGRDDHKIRIPKFKIVSISGVKVKQSAVLYLIKISFFCYLQTQSFTLYGELKKCLNDPQQASCALSASQLPNIAIIVTTSLIISKKRPSP